MKTKKNNQTFDQFQVLPHSLSKRIGKFFDVNEILYKLSDEATNAEIKVKSSREPITKFEYGLKAKNASQKVSTNWLENYCKEIRKDRIKWNTKLYADHNDFDRKPLHDQIEDLIDVAAREFTEWLNTLSSDDKNKMQPETVKKMFSIEIEKDIATSLSVSMAHEPVVDAAIAQNFNCPEVKSSENIFQIDF